ncbi:MAG: oxidoreductase protein [uncultured bacterium]|nr:MAG: oxidoreductase protein [uncultured bacterium]
MWLVTEGIVMINMAQIGVGYWGPNLLRNLVSNTRCEVVKVAEISEERRKFVQSNFPKISVTESADDIINDSNIDAVIIATPALTHFDLAMRALNAGKHILVEKPMATTPEEMDRIIELSEHKKLVAMAGHTFLFNGAVRYLKKLIDSGELGEIRYIYSQRLNLGRIRSDVDALWNFAPHDISIVQYLLNDIMPVAVNRQGMDYVQEGIEDVVFLNVFYPGKIMANIHVSWLDPSKIRKITLVGSKKMVVYDDVDENKITLYDKGIDRIAVLGKHMDYDHADFYKFNYRSGDIVIPQITLKEPLKEEIEHFLDCIEKGISCISGALHAKQVIRILANKLEG